MVSLHLGTGPDMPQTVRLRENGVTVFSSREPATRKGQIKSRGCKALRRLPDYGPLKLNRWSCTVPLGKRRVAARSGRWIARRRP